MWPGVPIVPTMSTGATDGKYLRIAGIPTYGIACIFLIWKTTAPTAKTSA
jgi:hypothetical protein